MLAAVTTVLMADINAYAEIVPAHLEHLHMARHHAQADPTPIPYT